MKKQEPKTLSGFMELMPNEQIAFNKMLDVIKNTYENYGFVPIDTPVIEYSEVLLAKAGGETEKQLYRFLKGDKDLSLRFDLTVPLAKYVASRYNLLSFPFKRYQIGKVYRGERAQRGRFREFYQCDIDVIGDESLDINYDVVMVNVIYDIFKKLNIADFLIRINNRKLLIGFLELNNINNTDEVLRVIDKVSKVDKNSFIDLLKEVGLNDDQINKVINFIMFEGSNQDKLEFVTTFLGKNAKYDLGFEELKTVINSIENLKLDTNNYMIDLKLSRGLDYYTGTIYETVLKDYPQIGSVGGGGRYDDLASFYTDKKLPGVGISIGLTRLFDQLKEEGLITINESFEDVLIMPIGIEYDYPNIIAKTLRNSNIKASVYYGNKNIKQMMKYADKINAKYSLILGEEEINSKLLTLKNMKTFEQFKLKEEDVIKFIKEN